MRAKMYSILPKTVHFAGQWMLSEQQRTYEALLSVTDMLTTDLRLHYERVFVQGSAASATIFDCYSATLFHDGVSLPLVADAWDFDYFLRRLLHQLRNMCSEERSLANEHSVPSAHPTITPSPLEQGRWYTKRAFEQQYQVKAWQHLVIVVRGDVHIRMQAYAVQQVLRQHKNAYFQLIWNEQPFVRELRVPIQSRRGRGQTWRAMTMTYQPYTTVRLRVCYALQPQQDTEIVLYDGYGLPEQDRWWRRGLGYRIQLP